MTIEQASSRKPPVGMVLVLVAAGLFYGLMLLSLVDLYNGGGDAMGRGIAVGFGFVFGGVLWLLAQCRFGPKRRGRSCGRFPASPRSLR
jgi:hypothetical protein